HGYIVLRRAMTKLGREFVPRNALRQILGHALSSAVHDRDLKLRLRMLILRRAFKPGSRSLEVLCNAAAFQIEHPEDELRLAVPPCGSFLVPGNRFRYVRLEGVFAGIEVPQLRRCGGMSPLRRLPQ